MCRYILHDAGKDTSDRVLWAETCNLMSAPENAWFEMSAVARDQARLKEQAGQQASGRKNTKPVLHYTLSWAARDNPTPEHMRETALASLKALKLDQHQALMAAHSDKDHLHVHIVVNTIHPETGMTAPLKYTKAQLSLWAEAYEKEHGIHCEQRIRNNAARDRIRDMDMPSTFLSARDCSQPQPDQDPPYVPVKHRGSHRRRWYERQDVIDRMKRLRAEMDVGHKVIRNATWEHQKRERDELDRNCKAACQHAREHIEQLYRPRWRELYRAQKKEIRTVEREATHPFERAVFVFQNRERLGYGKRLSFRQMVSLIRHQGRLLGRLDAVHEKERRSLAQAEKVEKAVMVEPILVKHEKAFARMREQQALERTAERDTHFAATRSITFAQAKASMRADPYVHETVRGVFKRDQDVPSASRTPEEIKRQMEEWRRRNPDRDFGREM